MDKDSIKIFIMKTAAPSLNRIADAIRKRESVLRDNTKKISAANSHTLPSESPVAKALRNHANKLETSNTALYRKTNNQVKNVVNLKSRNLDGAMEIATFDRRNNPGFLTRGIEGRLL